MTINDLKQAFKMQAKDIIKITGYSHNITQVRLMSVLGTICANKEIGSNGLFHYGVGGVLK